MRSRQFPRDDNYACTMHVSLARLTSSNCLVPKELLRVDNCQIKSNKCKVNVWQQALKRSYYQENFDV